MFANYLIGLREGLEAALVVSVLVAYLVRTGRRSALPYVWAGVGVAVGLSVAVGALLQFTSASLSFEAQERFGGIMSILAVAFVTWMIFWMRRASRSLSGELRGRLDAAVAIGGLAVVLMAFVAVAREGLETSVFFWAAAQATGSTTTPLVGFTLGLATAIGLGLAIYRSALRINLGTFFFWTGLLLIFVAAGVLSYGVHDLQEGDVLPGLHALAFDVSDQIPPASWYGTVLKGTVNFSPATTVLQAVVWVLYLVPVLSLFVRRVRRPSPPPTTTRARRVPDPEGLPT